VTIDSDSSSAVPPDRTGGIISAQRHAHRPLSGGKVNSPSRIPKMSARLYRAPRPIRTTRARWIPSDVSRPLWKRRNDRLVTESICFPRDIVEITQENSGRRLLDGRLDQVVGSSGGRMIRRSPPHLRHVFVRPRRCSGLGRHTASGTRTGPGEVGAHAPGRKLLWPAVRWLCAGTTRNATSTR
jgi:hypothetical protein